MTNTCFRREPICWSIKREGIGLDYAYVRPRDFLDFIESSCRKWHRTWNGQEQNDRKSDATPVVSCSQESLGLSVGPRTGSIESAICREANRRIVEPRLSRACAAPRESGYPANRGVPTWREERSTISDLTICNNLNFSNSQYEIHININIKLINWMRY